MKILRNLTQFRDEGLSDFRILQTDYRTNPSSVPNYGLALAFGGPKTRCSKNLGRAIRDAHYFFCRQFPIIGQKAVLDNIGNFRLFWSVDSRTCFGRWINPPAVVDSGVGRADVEAKLNTYEALEIAMQVVKEKDLGVENALYFAHPAHMERVVAIAEKMGFKGVPFVETEAVWNTEARDVTKNPEKWKSYELKVRIHHMIKGYVDRRRWLF